MRRSREKLFSETGINYVYAPKNEMGIQSSIMKELKLLAEEKEINVFNIDTEDIESLKLLLDKVNDNKYSHIVINISDRDFGKSSEPLINKYLKQWKEDRNKTVIICSAIYRWNNMEYIDNVYRKSELDYIFPIYSSINSVYDELANRGFMTLSFIGREKVSGISCPVGNTVYSDEILVNHIHDSNNNKDTIGITVMMYGHGSVSFVSDSPVEIADEVQKIYNRLIPSDYNIRLNKLKKIQDVVDSFNNKEVNIRDSNITISEINDILTEEPTTVEVLR